MLRVLPVALLLLAVPATASAAANGPLAIVDADGVYRIGLDGTERRLAATRNAGFVARSRDGSILVYGADDRIFMRRGDRTVRSFRTPGLSVNSLAISPDGKRIAFTAFRDRDSIAGHIYPYTARIDGTRIRSLRTHRRFVTQIAFLRDGRLLYVGTGGQEESSDCNAEIRRIRADGTQDVRIYHGPGGESRPCPQTFSLSPGGSALAMAAITSGDEPAGPGPPPGVYRLAVRAGALPKPLAQRAANPAWSPAGDQIAFTSYGAGAVVRIPAAGGEPVRIAQRFGRSITWLSGA